MPDEYISRAKALSAVQKQRGANSGHWSVKGTWRMFYD